MVRRHLNSSFRVVTSCQQAPHPRVKLLPEKKTLAGWVFRVEVITNAPIKKTRDMMSDVVASLIALPDVEAVKVKELYEDITMFRHSVEPNAKEKRKI
jgi:hypothetical protein